MLCIVLSYLFIQINYFLSIMGSLRDGSVLKSSALFAVNEFPKSMNGLLFLKESAIKKKTNMPIESLKWECKWCLIIKGFVWDRKYCCCVTSYINLHSKVVVLGKVCHLSKKQLLEIKQIQCFRAQFFWLDY